MTTTTSHTPTTPAAPYRSGAREVRESTSLARGFLILFGLSVLLFWAPILYFVLRG